MGKVQKKATDKHKLSLSPALTDFIEKATTLPLADLPAHLETIPSRWPFPRGDLYNWIGPLDRFDDILAKFNSSYGLTEGPQVKSFGLELLLDGTPSATVDILNQKGFGPDGDRELIEAVLSFSRLLLEKCGNRTLYNSTERLNQLLNTTSLTLLHKTLRLTLFLAQRFGSRPPQQQYHVQFYHFDLDRLLKLASPLSSFAATRIPQSPTKSSKQKDKTVHGRLRRVSTSISPNDFRALGREETANPAPISAADEEWQVWANVKVVWSRTENAMAQQTTQSAEEAAPDPPSSPTPVRRVPTNISTVSNASARSTGGVSVNRDKSGLQQLELSAQDLQRTNILQILQDVPADMPKTTRYELLHKLRIAYALTSSSSSRALLLQNRLTALSILGHVYSDDEFSHKYFDGDPNPSARQQLVQQIVSLLRTPKSGTNTISMYTTTLAMESLCILARQRILSTEIVSAMSPVSSHGLLISLVRKGIADLESDDPATDNEIGDDWREAIFSLYSVFISPSQPSHARSSENIVHPSLVSEYASGLKVISDRALRIHLRILDFMKNFFHHFRDGLQVLTANGAFDTACEALQKLSQQSLDLLEQGKGIPSQFKTQVTDYQIPYMHQQVIRSLIDLVNDIPNHQGNHADRALRSLVDSTALLHAFRSILSRMAAFGAHTWSEVVKAICGFLNNEPTSFTVVSEAGIITTLLQTVQPSPPASPEETGRSGLTISAVPSSSPLALPPIMDAIVNLATAFAPICLTESGHRQFVDSGVLQKFFEIFESPAHVVAIKDSNTLALLGSTFDELVRHQPGLKDLVMSSVITMIARVRHICRSLSWKVGAGPKIWLNSELDPKMVSGGATSLLEEIVANFDGLEIDFHPITLPDQSTLQSGPISEEFSQSVAADVTDKDSHGLTALDYARPAICFLLNFFDNHSLCKDFMNAGATDLVMDFISLPSIPVADDSFSSSGPINELPALIHMMAEEKPHLVVPALVDRALYATEHLDEFTNYCPEHVKCYFSSFLKHDASPEAMDIDIQGPTDIAGQGTKFAKALMTIYSTCRVLSELFSLPIYPSRNTANTLIHTVNVTDVLAKLVRSLGNLSAACCREEISLQSLVPLSWLHATKPGQYSSGDHNVDVILNVAEESTVDTEVASATSDAQRPEPQRRESLSKIRETPAFLNCRTLRYLLIEVPSSINDFILRLGSSFNGKRKIETFGKQKIAQIAEAIASAWTIQLDPPFLHTAFLHDNDALTKEWRFKYFDVALQNVRNSCHDDSGNTGRGKIKQTFVIDAFRRHKGMKLLTNIGTEFFDELKSCQVARPMFAANIGLKIVLELFDDLTSSSNIVSSTQAAFMKNTDERRPFYFNPSQVLLELRMEALKLTRKIWDSEYAEQASTDIVEKLISVLKHTLTGEAEADAVRSAENWPTLTTHPRRKFALDMVKVSHLKQKGFSEGLAKEALYRCNTGQSSHLPQAEEYCGAMRTTSRRRQLPVPEQEIDYRHADNAENADSSVAQSLPGDTVVAHPLGPTATIFEDSGPDEDVADNGVDTAEDDVGDPSHHPDDRVTDPPERNASTMEISNILNGPQPSGPTAASVDNVASTQPLESRFSVQSMDAERESIREDLPERCNNILNNHPNLVFDLNDLLSAATQQLPEDQAKSWLESTTSLLVMSLVSYKIDEEMTAAQATKIASVAYLLGLLSNSESFKSNMLKVFQDSFDDLVDFVHAPPTRNGAGGEGYPWIAKILLIFEKMLALDSEPTEFRWSPPNDLETASEPKLSHEPVMNMQQKAQLLSKICDLLPKVGKDITLALSIVRVLVILTRNRDLATKLGERQNLQKLFVMAKQLSGSANGPFEKSFMLVLRHIIEDEETIKQIMRSEITAIFENRPSQRSFDVTNYLRELYPLALRSPELFVEVSNEKVKLKSWSGGHNLASTPLILRNANEAESSRQGAEQEGKLPAGQTISDAPAHSIEQPGSEPATNEASKSLEVKPPTVERPDGVIHFLLSQLLTYKDVEEGEPASTEQQSTEEMQQEPATDGAVVDESEIEGVSPTKSDKPRFKADEHPIFMYQCFLLHCLVELLYSYNQTKVEFINFSRKADPMAATPSKPRSGVLNYLLNSLVSSGYVEKDDTITCKKRMTLSEWAMKVVVALCTKTGEAGMVGSPANSRYATQQQIRDDDTEPDLAFVRRFVLEHAIKAFKDATSSTEPMQTKYGRLLCLSDLFNKLMTKPSGPDGAAGSHNTSYKMLARMMFEKNLIFILTSAISDIDLSFPSAKKVIKFILRPLQELTGTATTLGQASPEVLQALLGSQAMDDISSASSEVSELDDDREETPDLYRNSALGMLDPDRPEGSESSDDEEDDDDEDDEMYDMGYDDEMDLESPVAGAINDGEVVSDEELEEAGDPGPIEGLPGDVPMDIEFVMGPNGHDHDDDEEDESDSSEDDDDEDGDSEEDADDDDIEIEMEDDDGDEVHSHDDEHINVHDNEDDWEDEDEDEDGEPDQEGLDDDDEDGDEVVIQEDITFDGDDLNIPGRIEPPAHLNNLFRVMGEAGIDGSDPASNLALVMPPDDEEEDNQDDDDDDDEGVDEVDWHGGFDMMLDGPEDFDDSVGLDWDEPPPAMIRRHRHTRGPGGIPGFFTRRIMNEHDMHHHIMGPRHHRHAPSGRGTATDEGLNPLLQRPDPTPPSGVQGRPHHHHHSGPVEINFNMPLRGGPVLMPGTQGAMIGLPANLALGGHGAILDAILGAIQRGESEPDLLRNGQLTFNLSAPISDIRDLLQPSSMGPGMATPRQREDPSRSAQFVPMPTNSRWQEEARLLYGRSYISKIQPIQIRLLHRLSPLAQEEEKERRRKQEEERKAEEELQARLKVEEEERKRKEEEEQQAKEKAEAEERARTEAEAAAREAEARVSEAQVDVTTTEAMEDVQSAQAADAEASTAQAASAPRVYTTIRGRQLDITDLGIDPGYLEALPEDFRQEVIMGVYQERREQGQEEGRDESGIDPEFLEALPEDLRESLRREAAAQQRRQERDRARREAQGTAGLQATADMDNDDFFATLDPALRRQILAEQPPEVLNTLNAQHAAEGRAHARAMLYHHPIHSGRDLREERTRRDQAQRDAKRQIVQLVDKAGVATLLRLMFLQQQGSLKSSLLHILGHVCGNRQTRFEIVSLLLVILKEGSTDVTAVERSLASLSLRAKATAAQKTPQPLKRTLSMQPYAGISEEVTPMLVVQQCLNTLSYICRQNFHVKALFLREVDVTSGPKPKGKSKGKGKESRTTKYPINDLISLLDRTLIMESSSCLHSLALLLATVTSPLALLIRQEKERVEAEKLKESKSAEGTKDDSLVQTGDSSQQKDITVTGEDTAMTDSVSNAAEAATATEPAGVKNDQTDAEKSEPEAERKKQPFEPPTISDHNLKLIVSIFVANECGNETFHSTLEALESLAHVPGTSEVFGQELIRHVQLLSQQICTDLEDFLPAIRDAQSSTDVQGVAAARFSASTSDQVKLLRVLQALDYLSAPKKDDEPEEKSAKAKSILNMSYSTLSLGPLWSRLSDCLAAVEEKGDTISFANILLPLIESLMVVCKNTTLKDAPIAQQVKEGALTSPIPKDMSDLEELFFKFTSEHRKILNDIVRQMPKLMQGPFSILVKNSKVLDFDNKRNYFTKQIHSRHHAQRHPQPPLQLNVRRDQVFIDSYKALYFKTAEEMKHGKLNIRFNGEEGVDAGGVTREWFQVLARGMFDPNYALFHPVASDRTTFHPSTLSRINPEHLLYFKFVGRIIGKALHEGRVLDCHFSRAVYKRILGKSPNLKDLESNDMDYYKSLVWILENDITDILTEEFCVIEDEFGEEKVIDLIPDGRNVAVTEENKKEYVQKLVEYRLTESVKEQLDSFLQGFHDIIPAELISIFNEQELELLISGLPEIDVDDWKANTEYHNYNPSSQQVVWFWRIVKAMSNEERAKLLQFITGTSKVPLNGFKELEGVSGLTKCNIHKDPSQTRLPTSHTCFNQLDLPAYDNFETMKQNLTTAINLGADYFGFA